MEVTEYLLVPLCEYEANKISFSSCLQQPVIHLSKDCLDAVSHYQAPSWPSGHARLLPGLLVTPDSSLAFWSHQAPSWPSGHARLLRLLVTPGSFLAFLSCQAPSQPSCHARLLPSLLVTPAGVAMGTAGV